MHADLIVCQRYAKALFKVARKLDRVDDMGRELGICAEALAGDDQGRQFWARPITSLERKERLLGEALKSLGEAVSRETRRFVHILVRNGRLGLIHGIRDAYADMSLDASGTMPVKVCTAKSLSGEQRKALEAALSVRVGGRVILKVREDPSLLGGMTVMVRDVLYDGSARGRLERFLHKLETG